MLVVMILRATIALIARKKLAWGVSRGKACGRVLWNFGGSEAVL